MRNPAFVVENCNVLLLFTLSLIFSIFEFGKTFMAFSKNIFLDINTLFFK